MGNGLSGRIRTARTGAPEMDQACSDAMARPSIVMMPAL